MSSSRHVAPGPATGYLYQCEHALVDLLAAAQDGRNVVLFIEKLDDVHLEEDGRAVDVLQLKHHSGPGGSLTDESVDLWRTINVWIALLERLEPDEHPDFSLLTTATAPDGTAASRLRRDDKRDPREALASLRSAAANATALGTAEWRRAFAALDQAEQQRLVESIVVRDREPEILAIDTLLLGRLRMVARSPHLAGLLESLKGWWYARCVAMLQGVELAIAAQDVLEKIQDLRDAYHKDNLPFDYDLAVATAEERAAYETSLFIRQLRWVAASSDLLTLAIDEYHRSYANKSRWLRLGLLTADQLDEYEKKLVLEWRRERAFMLADLDSTADEVARARAGLGLWRQLSNSMNVRIRPRFEDQNLTRGSYHELADRAHDPSASRIGWHPDFEERLRELLEGAA